MVNTRRKTNTRRKSIKRVRMISKKKYTQLLKKKRVTRNERNNLDHALFTNYCKCIKRLKYSKTVPKGAEYPICISSIYKNRGRTPPRNIKKKCKKYY
jgi:hypothetical protein